MNTNITINHKSRTITFPKAFEETAFNTPDSPESKTIMNLRQVYPDYSLRTAKSKKQSYKGLSMEVMQLYLEKQSNDEKGLADFHTIKEYYTGDPYVSAKVKSWFLKRCPTITAKDIEDLKPLADARRKALKDHAMQEAIVKSQKIADDIMVEIKKEIAKNSPNELVLVKPNETASTSEESVVNE
jgi:3-methyladenine DNA glycosylase AlkD